MSAQRRSLLASGEGSPSQGEELPGARPTTGEGLRSRPRQPTPGPAAQLLDASRDELHRRVSQLTTLYQIGRAISESRNWTEALDYFLETLCDYLDVQGAGILLYSRECTVLAPRRVLGIAAPEMDACSRRLLEAFPARAPSAEIHRLECYVRNHGVVCAGHTGPWRFAVLPLLYRRTPLGFLIVDRPGWEGRRFTDQLFFLQTIQTILTEEVANAVHLTRLVDMKNFNEAVLESIESGVLTATEQGAIHYANRLARRTLGLDANAEILPPLRFDELFHSGQAGAFHRVLAAPGGRCGFEGLLHRRDGKRVPIRLRTSRIVNPSDSQPLILVVFEDLSEQRLLEEQLRRADRLRSLGELSAAIAHEVRNPLQGISLTLSNLRTHLKPGGAHYVDVMFQEMERLDSIVGNILSFARPAPPQPRAASLVDICSRAVELARERAAQRGVQVAVRSQLDDPACEVDEGQILQVVLNLVMNAIDASPRDGRVGVHLSAPAAPMVQDRRLGPGPVCRIEVHDQGPGIPDALRDKLFDPFFTTKAEGTGLGLSVSQKIIEEHHGMIHVQNEAGGGGLFVVELPRRFVGAFATLSPRSGQGEDASGCA